MMDLLVLLSHGHAGRPDRPFWLGATSNGFSEVDLSAAYMRACHLALRGWGADCWILGDGTLRERQTRAVDHGERFLAEHPAGLVLYVACHVNAGGGDYGAVLHDARSALGAELAEAIAEPLRRLPELARVVTPATPGTDGVWASAHATIRHVFDGPARMAAVCLEPFFIDGPAHRDLRYPGALSQIGLALAEGVFTVARRHAAEEAA